MVDKLAVFRRRFGDLIGFAEYYADLVVRGSRSLIREEVLNYIFQEAGGEIPEEEKWKIKTLHVYWAIVDDVERYVVDVIVAGVRGDYDMPAELRRMLDEEKLAEVMVNDEGIIIDRPAIDLFKRLLEYYLPSAYEMAVKDHYYELSRSLSKLSESIRKK